MGPSSLSCNVSKEMEIVHGIVYYLFYSFNVSCFFGTLDLFSLWKRNG